MQNLKLTDVVKRWIWVDAILIEQGAAPATLGELQSTLENAPRAEDAALLIIAMRSLRKQVFRVYQGGRA